MITQTMITQSNRRQKLVKSLEKLEVSKLIHIPGRIATQCIHFAKTTEAKERLVLAAMWMSTEDERRIWASEVNKVLNSEPKKTETATNNSPRKNGFLRMIEEMFEEIF